MKIFHSDGCRLDLPARHTFPIEKYRQLRERIQAAGLVADDRLVAAPAVGDADSVQSIPPGPPWPPPGPP